MTPLFAAALRLQSLPEGLRWKFCVIGGIAVLRWGEPRFTRDVDLTVLTGFGGEADFISTVLQNGYSARMADGVGFAL